MTQLIDHAVAGPFSGVLDGTFVGLGQSPTGTLTPTQPLSAITEATYDGYARLPLTWKPPYLNPQQNVAMQADGSYFTPTGTTTPNQITSLFVADALAAGNLLLSTVLPGGPIFFSGPQNAFSVSLLFQLLTGTDYGTPILVQ